MGRIPDDTIQEIRDRVDLVDLVGRHVSLRSSGRSFKGLCPFHDEKTPSFQVSRERQSYYCFGCGTHGDCFGYLMAHERLSFPEAARALAAEVGIDIPETGGGEPGLIERLVAANEAAQQFYQACLRGGDGAGARRYLAGRGLDDETVQRFGIGFAPDSWEALRRALTGRGIPEADAAQAGLLAERRSGGHYDLLRARIVFPIQDARGRVLGFGGRGLSPEAQPKYLNTPETKLFRKRECFYGLPFALEPIRRAERTVIVEGYFDCIALVRAGIGEALATCGTSLTERHAASLRKRTRNAVMLFDGDEAGQRAMERALEVLLPAGLRVSAALLPPGDDPDDLLAREGADALRARVEQAVPALDGVIQRAVAKGCATPWEKADAVNAVAPLLARVPDRVERHEFTCRLALAAGTEPRYAEDAVRRSGRGSIADEGGQAAPAPRPAPGEERHLRRVAQVLLDHPGHWAHLPHDEFLVLIEGSEWREVIAALLDARGGEGGLEVAALADRLSDPARAQLRELASEDGPGCDGADAARILHDTLRRLRERRQRSERSEATRQLRSAAGADRDDLFAVKARQLEERRRLTESP